MFCSWWRSLIHYGPLSGSNWPPLYFLIPSHPSHPFGPHYVTMTTSTISVFWVRNNVPVHCAYPMSIGDVLVHGACRCPCPCPWCMSMSTVWVPVPMVHVHGPYLYPWTISLSFVRVSVHAACPLLCFMKKVLN
jgi:hypothetical protein